MSSLATLEQGREQVTGLQLTLADRTLLVPNTAVAELVARLQKIDGQAAGAVLGLVEWRGLQLPLLSFERLSGDPELPVEGPVRLVVLNSLQPVHGQNFYALAICQIPRTLVVDAQLHRDTQAQVQPYELERVILEGRHLCLPDLAAIEAWLAEQPWPASDQA